MGLHCDRCEILLTHADEIALRAPAGRCPRCRRAMDKTRPVTLDERKLLIRLIREGKRVP